MIIRNIRQEDNPILAKLIRTVLEEYGVNRPGTVYTDPTTDDLYTLFQNGKSIYWVLEDNGRILGGCGIYPTEGLPEGCAELVKLYLCKEARGQGLGKLLIEKSIESARESGYTHLYLETMQELGDAIGLYQSLGFKSIDHAMGESGHFACEIRMLKTL